MLPNDLKHYRAQESFFLFDSETAGWILFACLLGALVLDRLA